MPSRFLRIHHRTRSIISTKDAFPMSLHELNNLAGNPPLILKRTPALSDEKPLVLYIFRVPGRTDFCLSTHKPIGESITDLDVSMSLFYVRFDTDVSDVSSLLETETEVNGPRRPSSLSSMQDTVERMVLLRNNPLQASTGPTNMSECALLLYPSMHVDVFARRYADIEPRYWQMNGMEVSTIKSFFGTKICKGESCSYFKTPWTGRCEFKTIHNGYGIRCSHSLTSYEGEEDCDVMNVSELRLNFPNSSMRTIRGQRTSRVFDTDPILPEQENFGSQDPRRFSLPLNTKRFSSSGGLPVAHPPGVLGNITNVSRLSTTLPTVESQNSVDNPGQPPLLPPRPPPHLEFPPTTKSPHPAGGITKQPSLIKRKPVPSVVEPPPPPPPTDEELPPNLPPRNIPQTPNTEQSLSGRLKPANSSPHLNLSLAREKLGGGFDGNQAKLGKLIIHKEGLQMLDLIVGANVLVFFRAFRAAGVPGRGGGGNG